MASLDPTFSVNNFNKPKVLSSMETYVNNILMLLFGKPGFYPSLPTIGMDIGQYLYRFEGEVNTEEIKVRLATQCSEFLPEIQNDNFDVLKTVFNDRLLLIFKLPIIDDTQEYSVALGVTTNTHGEMVYRFVENKTQMI